MTDPILTTQALAMGAGALMLAFVVSFAMTPASAKLARRIGLLDRPQGEGGYKKHDLAVPYLGGVAIVFGLLAGCLMMMFIPSGTPGTLIQSFPLVIVAAVILGAVGLADDFKSLPRSLRLAVQVAAAAAAYAAGFQVSFTPWDALDLAMTIIWIVGITNAFNLLDNMDGLTSGLAGIAALSFATLGVIGGMPLVTVAAASLAGASFGFLAHNRHPAKIFMGDAGSNFVGFMLALIGARLRFDNLVEVTFLVPVIVLGIPILDTTLVVVSRRLHGRPVFQGGRDHISHRLVHIGLSVPIAVGLLYWTGLCLGWLGIVVSRSDALVGWMLLGFVLAMGLFLGLLLLRVPVYEEQFEDVSDLREAEQREGDKFKRAVDNEAGELTPDERAKSSGKA